MTQTEKRVKFFQDIALFITQLANEGIQFMPFSFYRSIEEQKALVKQGMSKTLNSKHLRWLAIDLVLIENGKPIWKRTSTYDRAGEIWKQLGHVWGGDFKELSDIYHFEFKE